jgi:hypothetical protein
MNIKFLHLVFVKMQLTRNKNSNSDIEITKYDFDTQLARFVSKTEYENIYEMLEMIEFCESKGILDDDDAIESIMHSIEYVVKLVKVEEINFEEAQDLIWDLFENIETGNNDVYQKSTGYGNGYYEIPNKKEWYDFKKEIISEMKNYESYLDNEEYYYPVDKDDYDYDCGYQDEGLECIDM